MIIVNCPNQKCQCLIFLLEEEIGCAIYRHAMFKNGQFINPHLPEQLMEELIKQDHIWGCGSPFKLILENNEYKAVRCDWI